MTEPAPTLADRLQAPEDVRVDVTWFALHSPEGPADLAALRARVPDNAVPQALLWQHAGDWTTARPQGWHVSGSAEWAAAAGGPAVVFWMGDGFWGWAVYEGGGVIAGMEVRQDVAAVIGDVQRASAILGIDPTLLAAYAAAAHGEWGDEEAARTIPGDARTAGDAWAHVDFAARAGITWPEEGERLAFAELPQAPARVPFPIAAGDRVLVFKHGIGTVSGPEARPRGAVWVLSTDGPKILAPVDLVHQLARPLVSPSEAAKLLERAAALAAAPIEGPWDQRFRTYMAHVDAGLAENHLCVYSDLERRRRAGPISFGERKLRDTAQQLLAGELAEVLGLTVVDVCARLA